jgi:hypothetical protein
MQYFASPGRKIVTRIQPNAILCVSWQKNCDKNTAECTTSASPGRKIVPTIKPNANLWHSSPARNIGTGINPNLCCTYPGRNIVIRITRNSNYKAEIIICQNCLSFLTSQTLHLKSDLYILGKRFLLSIEWTTCTLIAIVYHLLV